MSAIKLIVALVLTLAVVSAAVSKNNTKASNVVESLLAAKTRLTAVNATANATESKDTAKPNLTKRSLGVDKSQGKR